MFKIILSDDFLELPTNSSDAFCTTFYVQIDDVCFPCDQWTDFTKSILSTWMENLIRNYKGYKSRKYCLYFMDGPFRIDVIQNGGELLLQGINFRKQPRIEFEASCSYEELLKELVKAFNHLEKIVFMNDAFAKKDSYLNDIKHYKDLICKELSNVEGT